MPYILERGIVADVSLVKAWKADPQGNLIYRKTARNFNPLAATCGKITVAEVEEIVPVGALDPDNIHTPGIFVHRLVHNPTPEKRIERKPKWKSNMVTIKLVTDQRLRFAKGTASAVP